MKTVLALLPHPDDGEFFAGGTLARFAREEARVILVIASDGRRGSFQEEAETLASRRTEEARRAAAVLGVQAPIFLGHPDLELDLLPPGLLREQFVRAIREWRPDVVIAPDPFAPYEPHPDHRAVAWAASDAIHFAGLPLLYPEQGAAGLEPHFVVETYFYSEYLPAANHVVDISATMEIKIAALAEHRSQVEFLVEDVLRQARLAGLDLGVLLGEGPADPLALLTWALKTQAAEVGRRNGLAFGEAFRYVRFHPLVESLLAQAK